MLFRSAARLPLLLLLANVALARASKADDALAVVPEEALLAIAIRNVSELTKRGDTFIEKTEFKTPIRLSDGYKFVVGYLGLKNGLDETGSAVLMSFKPDLIAVDELVLAVPIKDVGGMASNFELRKQDLTEGKVIDRRDREGDKVENYVRYLAVRGSQLYMGGSEKYVKLAATGKTVAEVLPADDRDALAADDILLYVNPRSLGREVEEMVAPFGRDLDSLPPEEAGELKRLLATSKELRYAFGGLRLDEGLGATLLLRFEGEKSADVLSSLASSGKSKTTLSGLPIGKVLAAHAASGDGDKSSTLARALIHMSLAGFAIHTEEFVSAGHRPNVVGVFGEIWQRLEGSRAAVYENDKPERDGHFSLLAVLDTEDSGKFIAEMAGLARFVNASGLSLDDAAESIDAKTIAELIAQLGHDEYRVRQSAGTRLGLAGKAALPALETALSSTDVEVQFRAKALKQQINAALADEREDLLKRDLLSRIRPNFAFFPKVERRGDQQIDIVQLRLKIDEVEHTAQLRRLLGPDWSKLRMASVGKRVVVLFGSNTRLFEEAIGNVESGAKGIEEYPHLAKFRSRPVGERTVEFHFSVAEAQRLVVPATEPETDRRPGGLTSLGLSISRERVRLDLFSPHEEVKSVVKKWAW